jgi:hypothetical protein
MFRVGGVDTVRFVQDLKHYSERVLLLEDPYLRDAGGTPERALRNVDTLLLPNLQR